MQGNKEFTFDKKGYQKNRKGEYFHRLAAEKSLCRKLKPKEVVHHMDCDKSNNHPENLCVMDTGCHYRFHKKESPGPGNVYKDDLEFTYNAILLEYCWGKMKE